ncbi:MAG: hypothetical protein SF182_04975 [Deltaproteobacteria bacterium]|nr:hypothetical protein [Deltaproteobacteria bacterium]
MRGVRPWLVAIVIVSAIGSGAVAARAARPSCDDLTSALALGRTQDQVASEFGTTKARVAACVQLAAQEAMHAAQHERFEQRRADRGLPMP